MNQDLYKNYRELFPNNGAGTFMTLEQCNPSDMKALERIESCLQIILHLPWSTAAYTGGTAYGRMQ